MSQRGSNPEQQVWTKKKKSPKISVLTNILILVVLDEISKVHIVADDSHLVSCLIAVVQDATVSPTK